MVACRSFSVAHSCRPPSDSLNPVNVAHPQSLRHVTPICEFTAPDTRENLAAAMFHAGNPCKQDMEDVLHRRCVLFRVQFGDQVEVGLVTNTSERHHRLQPDPLPKGYEIRCYEPVEDRTVEDSTTKWLQRVTSVDFTVVTSTLSKRFRVGSNVPSQT